MLKILKHAQYKSNWVIELYCTGISLAESVCHLLLPSSMFSVVGDGLWPAFWMLPQVMGYRRQPLHCYLLLAILYPNLRSFDAL